MHTAVVQYLNWQKLRFTAIFLTLIYFFTTTISPVLANISYPYDKNGNMTSDGINCYTYNDENQLVKTTNCATGKLIDQSTYDDQGKRIKQQIYDQNGNLLKTMYTPFPDYEYTIIASTGAKLSTTYYHANGEVVARKNPDKSLTYYLHDNLGSTTTLLDQNGKVIENTTYAPYGAVTSGGTQSKHLYTDQVNDTQANPQSHLDYYNARYYNPHTMHFTQPDTQIHNIYDPQQLNRYAYVGNNPMSKNDPSGHFEIALGLDIYFLITDINQVRKQPKNPINWAYLGLDTISLIPGAPDAMGQGLKLAKNLIKIGEKGSEVIHTGEEIKDVADSAKYLTKNPETGWKLGQPINNYTSKGNIPAWSTVRQRFWKTEALNNPMKYSSENISRMSKGLAPLDKNSFEILEPLELNHVPPQREGGLFDFDIVSHEEHVTIDPYRY